MAKRSNTAEFISKAVIVHGDRYDYSKSIYSISLSPMTVTCRKHGDFIIVPKKHLINTGCPLCYLDDRKYILRMDTQQFLEKAVGIHGDRYDYSAVEYVLSRLKVAIICRKHGVFYQEPNRHLSGGGCPKCKAEHARSLYQSNKNEFISRSNKIHNNKYDYSLVVYVNAHIKVKIMCLKHGVFEQEPNSHLHGNGCPSCKNSQGENRIISILNKYNIPFIKEKTFPTCKIINHLKFDFFFPHCNILLEYQGEQHYTPWKQKQTSTLERFMKVKRNDEYKKRWAIENGYVFKEYTYRDSWKFIEKDILKTLK